MSDSYRRNFLDLKMLHGLGGDPVWYPPELTDRPRLWPLDKWAEAPRGLGFPAFFQSHWRGVRLLKDPMTLSVYHNLLWELRPRVIIETGVYSGGSLLWFRDITRAMGFDCQVIGIDNDLSRCQIPTSEMSNIVLYEGDLSDLESLEPLRSNTASPLLMIDDAHCNSFNLMSWCVDNLLVRGDYFIIEDTMASWQQYTPELLVEYLAAFRDVFEMDMVYANSCSQLERGVFRRI